MKAENRLSGDSLVMRVLLVSAIFMAGYLAGEASFQERLDHHPQQQVAKAKS